MPAVIWKSETPLYRRVLNGQFALATAFFVVGMTGIACLAGLNLAVDAAATQPDRAWATALTAVPRSLRHGIEAVGLLLLANCVWRSSRQHDGDRIWPVLANLGVIAALLAFAGLPSSVMSRAVTAAVAYAQSISEVEPAVASADIPSEAIPAAPDESGPVSLPAPTETASQTAPPVAPPVPTSRSAPKSRERHARGQHARTSTASTAAPSNVFGSQ